MHHHAFKKAVAMAQAKTLINNLGTSKHSEQKVDFAWFLIKIK